MDKEREHGGEIEGKESLVERMGMRIVIWHLSILMGKGIPREKPTTGKGCVSLNIFIHLIKTDMLHCLSY